MAPTTPTGEQPISRGLSVESVLRDYRIAYRSRQCSIVARKEVFGGRAKFGIFGEGKEVAQLAMARAFRKGDFRSGYYRDQTLMFALDLLTPEQFFSQLYGHADVAADPATGGRAMTSHFATRLLDDEGRFVRQTDRFNSSADLSPTASQMPRLVGLAYASRLYRESPELRALADGFTSQGEEIVFGTIGEASCAEGLFWESVNALGVLQVPALVSIWDDGFGISVPNAFQMTKGDVGQILEGFERTRRRPGIALHAVHGWDYPALCDTYRDVADEVRRSHAPSIVHVTELTQPYGHSTSGNHERYKSAERLAWEQEYDCLPRLRTWILDQQLASAETLDRVEAEEAELVLQARDRAWDSYRAPIEQERQHVLELFDAVAASSPKAGEVQQISESLRGLQAPLRRHLMAACGEVLLVTSQVPDEATRALADWKREQEAANDRRYGSHLYSESVASALNVEVVPARFAAEPPTPQGFEVMQACFDAALQRYPQLVAIGEDVGRLGGVNLGWAHLQQKHGSQRITDTGIREATIIGQAIGMALRGLKPIAEIQYLDYLLYALQIISDDLATLRWRTHGGQKAPVIISTRGHRLEGIWHSGSPMAAIVNLMRGLYVCVPRDAVQAAGFYNTMLQSDDAALIVEVLNAYRKRLRIPENIGEFTIPLGVPEIIRTGADVTVVTYGACCDIAMEAALVLERVGIDVEIVDVRTLLPFDTGAMIRESIEKTSRVLFLDEDYPGGVTAYMMQDVLERQAAFDLLDAAPRTLSSRPHRPAYGSDGDYFSKPNREQIVEVVYQLMSESDPRRFPPLGIR